jgi:hypothetical protein
MYRPCNPVALTKQKNDPRPAFAGFLFSSRMDGHRVEEMNIELDVVKRKGKKTLYIPYRIPKES